MNSNSEKIKNINNFKVLTPSGWKQFSGMRRLKNWLWDVKFENGNSISVTHDHPFSVFTKGNIEHTAYLSELYVGDRLQTKNGYCTITDILSTNKFEWTYDLLDVDGAVFYVNDIVSHNCFLETGQSAIDSGLLNYYRSIARKPSLLLEDGAYKIWEQPVEGNLYVIGVDVGEGIGQAASVAHVFNITDLSKIKLVASYHNNNIDPFHFAEFLYNMTMQWGQPHLAIERNNCGGQVIDALTQVHNYHNLIDYTPEKQKYYNRLGIYSHTNAKYKGVMNMRYWVNSLRAVDVYDISVVQELESFVRYPNGTWKAKAGDYIYDDRVMALVWGLFVLETEIAEKYYDVHSYDERGKPSKLEAINVVESKYFKIDNVYVEAGAPLPTHFSIGGYENDDSMEDLEMRGWSKL